MHEHDLPGLPVINDRYEVSSYINLLELLAVCVRQLNTASPDAGEAACMTCCWPGASF
jgi:hypothetical protein